MKLHNYQHKIINFCSTRKNAVLSVGMGLGKTAAILHYINQVRPSSVLIVAPKRVAETVWKQEAEKWGLTDLSEKLTIVSGSKAKRQKLIESNHYLIIGRDNLSDVEGLTVDLLVIDELTSFKNPFANRTSSICSINAKQRIGLTGTFLTNGAIDCFGQFCAVGFGNQMTDKERKSAFYRWRATHFKDLLAGSGLQFQKWKLVTPLEQLISKVKNDIFTLDSSDWLEIPPVQHFEHYIELTGDEMDEYMKLDSMLNICLDDEVLSFTENQKFAKLQTLCNGFVYDDDGQPFRSQHSTKLDEVVEFVDRCAGEGERVLLFYAFKEEKAWIVEKLKKLHLKFTDIKDKKFLSKWESGEIDVLLAHPASAGHGLNLQHGGRICVWSTIPFDYELWSQANARLARQGQNKGVQIHAFMAKDTVEKRKYIALREKNKIAIEFIEITK